MNLLKKYLWMTISLAVAFILLAAVGGRLFFVYKSHAKEQRELDDASGRLDQLYNRATFPSPANIIREKQRLNDLVDEYNELHGLLATGQVLPQEMEGAEFMTFLGNTLRRMRDRLQVGRVAFPGKYSFGFEDYDWGGKMPVPEAIPRLVQQLKIVETICNLLPDAAVTELVSFTREDFEKQAGFTERLQLSRAKKTVQPPAAGSGPAGEGLYTTQRFIMNFRAREGSVLDLLNRLARLPMFAVVTRIEIVNPRSEFAISGAGLATPPADQSKTAATAAPTEEVSRDKRICLGREDVEVKLEMDVYNFGPAMEFREGTIRKKPVASSQ